jgi:hypothetical protein
MVPENYALVLQHKTLLVLSTVDLTPKFGALFSFTNLDEEK